MLGFEPRAAGCGSKYADHCAMLPSPPQLAFFDYLITLFLPFPQAGGHGTCITQCKSARVITRKTIPMQVDGEASRLNPATIELSFLNQVCDRQWPWWLSSTHLLT